jgi:hypothetical protein
MSDEGPACVVVCAPAHASVFADDLKGECDGCGKAICWRPTAPEGMHVCLECCPATDVVMVTRETVEEVLLYLARTKGTQ